MDQQNNYDEYQHGDTTNEQLEENKQEVNFVMRNPEPEQEEEKKEEIPTYNYSSPNSEKPKQKKKSGGWKKWVVCVSLAIVFGLVASAVFQTSNFIVGKVTGYDLGTDKSTDKTVSTTVTKGDTGNNELTDVAQVAANVMPSVVSITNLSVQEVQNFFFGGSTTQEYKSTGSGIIVGQNDTELLIVSNNHVVESSTSLTVSFVDGKSVEAKIKGTDATIDLAILAVPLDKIEEGTLDEIKIATLGDSDNLAVGEPAIAIGNALGYGQSVTYGIISAVERQIEGYDAQLIQTDAAINPGNSGGALLNQNGEVIGINTVKVSADAVEGMGYAIPISDVADIINELMNRETREKVDENKRGALGISGIDVDENATMYYNMPSGVYVSEVMKGSAAEKAGITQGSIITKFEGTSISGMKELKAQLEYYEAGEEVKLVVKVPTSGGGYEEKTYKVTLGEQSILDK